MPKIEYKVLICFERYVIIYILKVEYQIKKYQVFVSYGYKSLHQYCKAFEQNK